MSSDLAQPLAAPYADPSAGAVAATPPGPSPLARLFRSRGVWALGDQAVLSVGNFLTNLLLANHLPPALYGVYGLVFGVVLFLNSLHTSVVVYPLTVRGAACDDAALRRLTARGLNFTLLLMPLMLAGLACATASAHRPWLLPIAAVAMVLWQMQETLRRTMMARLRHARALPGDLISYPGQAAVVYVLYQLGRLTPETAFAAVAATSGLAALVQAFQLRATPGGWGGIGAAAREGWRLGRWLLLTNLVTVGTIYLTPWVVRAAYGPAEVAKYFAICTVLGLVNPILIGIGSLVVPAVAAARRHGPAAVRATALRYALLSAALHVPIFVALFAAPGAVLRLFFRARPEYAGLTTPLRLLVAGYALYLGGQICTQVFNGLEAARGTFVATLVGAAGNVAIVLPATLAFGLSGALWGGLAPVAAQTVVAVILTRRALRNLRDDRGDAARHDVGEVALASAVIPAAPAVAGGAVG